MEKKTETSAHRAETAVGSTAAEQETLEAPPANKYRELLGSAPATNAFDAQEAAEDAGAPWGDDKHRWRWCDPTRTDGGSRTQPTPRAAIDELVARCVNVPLPHPRLVRRTR